MSKNTDFKLVDTASSNQIFANQSLKQNEKKEETVYEEIIFEDNSNNCQSPSCLNQENKHTCSENCGHKSVKH